MNIELTTNESFGQHYHSLDNGDCLEFMNSRFGRPNVYSLGLLFRLHQENDCQMFEVFGLPESRSRGMSTLSIMAEGGLHNILNVQERIDFYEFKDKSKLELNLKIASNWGKYYPPEKLDSFLQYAFSFLYEIHKPFTQYVNISYQSPIDGREFDFRRAGCQSDPIKLPAANWLKTALHIDDASDF